MPHHLEPVDDLTPEWDERPIRRPPWWRWVAVLVIVAMVVATPFVYALYRLLH